jgi:serine/threonine protein kinase
VSGDGITTKYPQRYGPFVLAAPIGAGGGTADVWLALAPDGRVCVLKKLLRVSGVIRDVNEALFRRRADIALRLKHPSVAETYFAMEVNGELVIAEEYVDGWDLSGVRCWEMPLGLRVHVVREVAAALQFVHEFEGLGIVHRDIAPENVMVAFNGEVKLIDFGYASAPSKVGLTVTGHAYGRTAYAAQEVRSGGDADRRSDIFALGVVLWEVLATKRLWGALIDEKFPPAETLPPSRWNPDVPAELDAVVRRAIADDPDERFQTAAELGAALAPYAPPSAAAKADLAVFMEIRSGDISRSWAERRLADARTFEAEESSRAKVQLDEDERPERRRRIERRARRSHGRWTAALVVGVSGLLGVVASATLAWRHRSAVEPRLPENAPPSDGAPYKTPSVAPPSVPANANDVVDDGGETGAGPQTRPEEPATPHTQVRKVRSVRRHRAAVDAPGTSDAYAAALVAGERAFAASDWRGAEEQASTAKDSEDRETRARAYLLLSRALEKQGRTVEAGLAAERAKR